MRVRMRTSPLHTTLKCDVIKALRTGANHSKIVNNENETHKPLATTPHARPPGHRGNMKHDPSPYRLLPTISSWKWKLMLPFPFYILGSHSPTHPPCRFVPSPPSLALPVAVSSWQSHSGRAQQDGWEPQPHIHGLEILNNDPYHLANHKPSYRHFCFMCFLHGCIFPSISATRVYLTSGCFVTNILGIPTAAILCIATLSSPSVSHTSAPLSQALGTHVILRLQ